MLQFMSDSPVRKRTIIQRGCCEVVLVRTIHGEQSFFDMMQPKFNCLILEDDFRIAGVILELVEREGGISVVCQTIAEAERQRKNHEFHVYILDNYLPDGKGQTFFSNLRTQGVYAPCIMLTGVPEIATAVELTRDGLFDYLPKPIAADLLRDCLRRALVNFRIVESTRELPGVVADSPAMRQVYRLAQQAAANPETTLLLTGETGAGKEVVARLIHQLTFRADLASPMVSLNCSAVPSEMFEAELFGAEKGAYTGAQRDRIGLAEAAKGGTLFFDEIGEIPLFQQAKLLRFLETREFRRLGSTRMVRFEARIIAATNRSLETEVRAERFREDLWYRLNVFNINVPPLRERKEDIVGLVELLMDSLCKKSRRQKPMLKKQDLEALQNYGFPGNVRELRNIIERSLVQTEAGSKWLQVELSSLRKITKSAAPSPAAEVPPSPERDLIPIQKQEYILIRDALQLENGAIRRAAERLKISHQALLRRLEKWPELRQPNNNGLGSKGELLQ